MKTIWVHIFGYVVLLEIISTLETSSLRPTITPDRDYILLKVADVRNLKCSGNKDTTWIVPQHASENFYHITYNRESSVIELVYDNIESPVQTLVGYYYCMDRKLAKKTGILNETLLHQWFDEQIVSRIYVFLESADVVLAGPEFETYHIRGTLDSIVYLPCRPINRNIKQIRVEDHANLDELFTADPYRGVPFKITERNYFTELSCKVDGHDDYVVFVNITEISPPKIPTITADDYAYTVEKGTLTLRCSTDMDDEIEYSWKVPKNSRVEYKDANKTLHLKNVRKQYDEGKYTCIVDNSHLKVKTEQISIMVNVSATPSFIYIWETQHLDTLYADEDGKLTIAIKYVSLPKNASVTWTDPNNRILQNNTNGARVDMAERVKYCNVLLSLDNMQYNQFGNYTIMVDNGIDKRNLSINVKIKPQAPRVFVDAETILQPVIDPIVVFVVSGQPVPEPHFTSCRSKDCSEPRTLLHYEWSSLSNGFSTTYIIKPNTTESVWILCSAKNQMGEMQNFARIVRDSCSDIKLLMDWVRIPTSILQNLLREITNNELRQEACNAVRK